MTGKQASKRSEKEQQIGLGGWSVYNRLEYWNSGVSSNKVKGLLNTTL